MKSLVLAEKPSVGKDIARVLSCKKGGNGFLEGDKYIVTWALGHLVTLADPEKYDEKFKNWDINHLPIMPEKLQLVVIGQTSKQYGIIKELLNRKEVSEVIIATDAGREGELVARWILEKANCKKQVKRLWISSVTDKAIKEGFSKLKDGKQYINLYLSARSRAEADWIVGINATRCLTTKFNSQLSCGRVQTPTLAIIEKREHEIRDFKPSIFYGLKAVAEKVTFIWNDNKGDTRTFDNEKMKSLFEKIKESKEGHITEIVKKPKKIYPPKLYDLTELQRDAAKRFDLSPKETLNIMQKLYEHHKALTYPRTDSRYISSDIVPTLSDRIKACGQGSYAKPARKILLGKITSNPNFVDDKKVSDHHAIIPTEERIDVSDFTSNERKIYDLVITRFLSVFYPPYEYEQTTLKLKIGNEIFVAHGSVVIQSGFREITSFETDEDSDDEQKSQELPKFEKGSKIKIDSIKITEGKTTPPKPFNESTLLSAMENPAKYMQLDNRMLAKTLSETGGLGTVATRADIIEKLFDSFLIEKKGKEILTTSKGRQLLKLAPKDLKSPELTGTWESQLSEIASGKLDKETFLKEIRNYTKQITQEIKQSNETYIHDNITSTRCDVCGKYMLEVDGKKGQMLICSDRTCGNRKSVSIATRSKCPKCHKFMKLVGEGEGRRAICECGYKEKYDSFVKRKEADKDRLDKKDVQKYLKEINKHEINNPIADALKGIKF